MCDNEYTCRMRLGGGATSEVWKCESNTKTGSGGPTIVAVKYYNTGDPKNIYVLRKEILLMKKIPLHLFLPRLIEACEARNYIVVEYIEGKELGHYMTRVSRKTMESPSPAIIARLLSTSYDALRVLHRVGLVHRDIKFDNIIVRGARVTNGKMEWRNEADASRGAVLVDLGLSCEAVIPTSSSLIPSCSRMELVGSPMFQHPAIITAKINGTLAADNAGYVALKAGDTWALMYTFMGFSLSAFPKPRLADIELSNSPWKIFARATQKFIDDTQKDRNNVYLYKNNSDIDALMKYVLLQGDMPQLTADMVLAEIIRVDIAASPSTANRRPANMLIFFEYMPLIRKYAKKIAALTAAFAAAISAAVVSVNQAKKKMATKKTSTRQKSTQRGAKQRSLDGVKRRRRVAAAGS
jgi:serine/threonine protein kinase